MNEEFLSFIWKYRLFDSELLVYGNSKIEVVSPGEQNYDSGPDFFGARIKIDETLWVGNVEIHVKASDWNRHNHDKNQAFDNVILHVTFSNDMAVYTSKGRCVPNVELAFNSRYLENYNRLMTDQHWVSCAGHLKNTDPVVVTSWLSKMGIERLESKTLCILQNLTETKNDWEEAFYRQLTKSFGFHVNSLPFELLAKCTPYIIVRKYAHDLFQLEALLFGQAGFLHNDYSDDDHYNRLKKEYEFLRAKHALQPIDLHVWKFMRLRPSNFPTIRLAQLAALIHKQPSLFSALLDHSRLKAMCELLIAETSGYWTTHYTFGHASKEMPKAMGEESAKIIAINTVVPFFFVYGKMTGKTNLQDTVLQFLENMTPEQNHEIETWKKLGIIPKNAFDTQGLLHLKQEYCKKRRCLQCGIGARIIQHR